MTSVVEFDHCHLDGAARLPAARQRQLRLQLPWLTAHVEQTDAARGAIVTERATEGAAGVVALDRKDVAGFLIGAPLLTPPWRQAVWAGPARRAAAAVREYQVYRPLHAAWPAYWLERGRTTHYVVMPADGGAAMRASRSLGFGRELAHALKPPLPGDADAARDQGTDHVAQPLVRPGRTSDRLQGVSFGRAAVADAAEIVRLGRQLPGHQAGGPLLDGSGLCAGGPPIEPWCR